MGELGTKATRAHLGLNFASKTKNQTKNNNNTTTKSQMRNLLDESVFSSNQAGISYTRSELLTGLPKNYHDTYVRAIPKSTEGFTSEIRMRSSKATDQAGHFKYTLFLSLHIKHEVGENWWKLDKSWAWLKQLLGFHTELNCTFSSFAAILEHNTQVHPT